MTNDEVRMTYVRLRLTQVRSLARRGAMPMDWAQAWWLAPARDARNRITSGGAYYAPAAGTNGVT